MSSPRLYTDKDIMAMVIFHPPWLPFKRPGLAENAEDIVLSWLKKTRGPGISHYCRLRRFSLSDGGQGRKARWYSAPVELMVTREVKNAQGETELHGTILDWNFKRSKDDGFQRRRRAAVVFAEMPQITTLETVWLYLGTGETDIDRFTRAEHFDQLRAEVIEVSRAKSRSKAK